jgi:Fic family protein
MLSQELQSTNELEGVRSSKEEIVKTTRKMLNDNTKFKINKDRFKNVIKSYFELKEGNLKPPLDSRDCRKIYDEITSDGISKEDFPDGKYFRKNITYIYINNKEIHRGISDGNKTEEIIVNKIDNLLDFMNRSSINLHSLIKIAISHYYFGYIHPFYDGNGKTGRFISSIF